MRRAFTLIEILLVLSVIGLLMIFLVPKLTEVLRAGESQTTLAWMNQVAALADAYEVETGDFPSSSYEGLPGRPPNDTNVGSESLLAFLAGAEYAGASPDEDRLVNTDEDRFPKKVTRFAVSDAFEIGDAWGNPIAYFHPRDYGKKFSYQTQLGTGETDWSDAEARRSGRTGNYLRAEDFQLISAGPDGRFGTEDDLVLGADG
jgi:prepilin-type N-terminal cleavage/methylation domain-containing protein